MFYWICENKTYKKVKELINVCTFEASASIKKGAEIKGDEDMLHTLRSVNDDLIAAGARYHENCFALYVSKIDWLIDSLLLKYGKFISYITFLHESRIETEVNTVQLH